MDKQKFINWFDNLYSDEQIQVWNQYAYDFDPDMVVYFNDEYFFKEIFGNDIDGAVRAVCFGDYNYNHKYVWFNGYANLETNEFVPDFIDADELFDYYNDNEDKLKDFDFADELFEEEEEDNKENEDEE